MSRYTEQELEQRRKMHNLVCSLPMHERQHAAYQILNQKIRPNTFVTLATNQNWTPTKMKKLVGQLFGRMDRWYLGHTWLKEPIYMRTDGIGYIQNVKTNIHAHMLVRFNKGNHWGREMMIKHHWTRLCEGGSADCQSIYEIKGISDYCSREMRYKNFNADDQLIFLRDYMRT